MMVTITLHAEATTAATISWSSDWQDASGVARELRAQARQIASLSSTSARVSATEAAWKNLSVALATPNRGGAEVCADASEDADAAGGLIAVAGILERLRVALQELQDRFKKLSEDFVCLDDGESDYWPGAESELQVAVRRAECLRRGCKRAHASLPKQVPSWLSRLPDPEDLAACIEGGVLAVRTYAEAVPTLEALRTAVVAKARLRMIAQALADQSRTACGLFAGCLTKERRIDFPLVTEICDRCLHSKAELAAVVRLLTSELGTRVTSDDLVAEISLRWLKALTVAHELLYDQNARRALYMAPGLVEALKHIVVDAGRPPQKDIVGMSEARTLATELCRRLGAEAHSRRQRTNNTRPSAHGSVSDKRSLLCALRWPWATVPCTNVQNLGVVAAKGGNGLREEQQVSMGFGSGIDDSEPPWGLERRALRRLVHALQGRASCCPLFVAPIDAPVILGGVFRWLDSASHTLAGAYEQFAKVRKRKGFAEQKDPMDYVLDFIHAAAPLQECAVAWKLTLLESPGSDESELTESVGAALTSHEARKLVKFLEEALFVGNGLLRCLSVVSANSAVSKEIIDVFEATAAAGA